MEINGTLVKKIEKLADFQMRKATHIRFLENCLEANVVPRGLLVEKKVMVGENSNLQETVDRALQKFSLELLRLVSQDHSRQLHESKGQMLQIEEDLKKHLNDESKFNEISGQIFSKIEQKKNKIVQKQQKKLEKLIDARDCCITGVTKAPSKSQQKKNKNEVSNAPPVPRIKTRSLTEDKPAARGGKTKKSSTANKTAKPENKSQTRKQDKLGSPNPTQLKTEKNSPGKTIS